MNTWIIIWLSFWTVVMGLPNYLFKKYRITYYENSWQHIVFFVFSSILLAIIYRNPFSLYFSDFSLYYLFMIISSLFLLWLLVPAIYKNDYYTKKERLKYQLPKFFEVLFQQLCFLGGLLTFGVSPVVFGLIFFIVHIPMVFIIPGKFSFLVITVSLIGGMVVAYLQSQGVLGFLVSLFIHLLFWATFHYFLSRKDFLGIVPVKR